MLDDIDKGKLVAWAAFGLLALALFLRLHAHGGGGAGAGAATVSLAPAALALEVFLRPRPPRLPRRRLGFVGSVVSAAPSAAAGCSTTGLGSRASTGASAAASAAATFLRRRNQGKRKLLHRRDALHLAPDRCGRERARCCQ